MTVKNTKQIFRTCIPNICLHNPLLFFIACTIFIIWMRGQVRSPRNARPPWAGKGVNAARKGKIEKGLILNIEFDGKL